MSDVKPLSEEEIQDFKERGAGAASATLEGDHLRRISATFDASKARIEDLEDLLSAARGELSLSAPKDPERSTRVFKSPILSTFEKYHASPVYLCDYLREARETLEAHKAWGALVITDRPEFRGLWRSRCMNPDGTNDEGWSVTFVLDGEYCDLPYEPTAFEASAAALAILEGRAALGTSVDVGDVQRGRIRELEEEVEHLTGRRSNVEGRLKEAEQQIGRMSCVEDKLKADLNGTENLARRRKDYIRELQAEIETLKKGDPKPAEDPPPKTLSELRERLPGWMIHELPPEWVRGRQDHGASDEYLRYDLGLTTPTGEQIRVHGLHEMSSAVEGAYKKAREWLEAQEKEPRNGE